jgi:hypothetical protein
MSTSRSLPLHKDLLVDMEPFFRAVGVEERLHVDEQVFVQGQALDRLNSDRGGLATLGEQILDQHLACQPVHAVDSHGIRPADSVCAGAAEGQCAVSVSLDVEQQVEHPVRGQRGNLEGLPERLVVQFGVVPADLQGDGHGAGWSARLVAVALGRRGGGGGDVGCRTHQYLRSIGS